MRILVTGPPHSGKKTIAKMLDHDTVVAGRLEVEAMIHRHDTFDAAIIVVDAGHLCEGIFSYMTLVQTLGVTPIVSVLNKMDTIDNCKTQYVAMSVVLGECVPMGYNDIDWYNGTTINDVLEREVK